MNSLETRIGLIHFFISPEMGGSRECNGECHECWLNGWMTGHCCPCSLGTLAQDVGMREDVFVG